MASVMLVRSSVAGQTWKSRALPLTTVKTKKYQNARDQLPRRGPTGETRPLVMYMGAHVNVSKGAIMSVEMRGERVEKAV